MIKAVAWLAFMLGFAAFLAARYMAKHAKKGWTAAKKASEALEALRQEEDEAPSAKSDRERKTQKQKLPGRTSATDSEAVICINPWVAYRRENRCHTSGDDVDGDK
jgi:hypothetical protein